MAKKTKSTSTYRTAVPAMDAKVLAKACALLSPLTPEERVATVLVSKEMADELKKIRDAEDIPAYLFAGVEVIVHPFVKDPIFLNEKGKMLAEDKETGRFVSTGIKLGKYSMAWGKEGK